MLWLNLVVVEVGSAEIEYNTVVSISKDFFLLFRLCWKREKLQWNQFGALKGFLSFWHNSLQWAKEIWEKLMVQLLRLLSFAVFIMSFGWEMGIEKGKTRGIRSLWRFSFFYYQALLPSVHS